MKKLFFPFLGLCATLFLTQCDKIEEPFKEIGERKVAADTPYFETKTDFVQKYLLEDFTGHRCLNCPKAHDIMHEMQQQMGDTLVCMGIHSGENAEPAAAPFTADYRTEYGNFLDHHFSPGSYPKGMINRKTFNGKRLLERTEWKADMASLPRTAPEIGLQIKDTTVAGMDDSVYVFVKISYLQASSRPMRLYAVLLEDSIVSAQKNGIKIDTNYVHNHLLRTSLSPLEGSVLHAGTPVTQGESEIRAYALFRNPVWRWRKCSIVAFVTDAESEEVLQAELFQMKE